jgi:hypothetical protein
MPITSSFSAAPAAPVSKNPSKRPLNSNFTGKFHHKDAKDTKGNYEEFKELKELSIRTGPDCKQI